MASYISRKNSWLRCLFSFLSGTALIALMYLFLSGPRLGSLYDFLLRWRSSLVPGEVSRTILIIDSIGTSGDLQAQNSEFGQILGNDVLDPEAAASLLYTMTELGADTLIIQVPVLGLSSGTPESETEVLSRFNEEFGLLNANIRNLFDAIRTGSVSPADTARYVGAVIELSQRGKDRLLASVLRRENESLVKMESAAAFFGNVYRAGDVGVQIISGGKGVVVPPPVERNEYSRPRTDPDGVLRRIAPILSVPVILEDGAGEQQIEHIVYSALKNRRTLDELESIPLDRSGSILFELPPPDAGFNRVSIIDFLDYDEAGRKLWQRIMEGEQLGIFSEVEIESRPSFLYNRADRALREGGEHARRDWIAYRNAYFESISAFLASSVEVNLVARYETEIANLSTEVSIGRMTEMRDASILAFAALQESFESAFQLRTQLESALSGSLSILGDPFGAQASALLANALLQGSSIIPSDDLYLILAALFFVMVSCLVVKSIGITSSLLIGLNVSLLSGTAFAVAFVLSGYWLDPLIAFVPCAVSVLVSCIVAMAMKVRHIRSFRLAYAPFVSEICLKSVIQAGKPLPSHRVTAKAAILAINNTAFQNDDTDVAKAEPLSLPSVLAFHEQAAAFVKNAGGTIIGNDGNIVSACFGSPLQRVLLQNKKNPLPYSSSSFSPARNAVDSLSEVIRTKEYAAWSFGLDMGDCSFTWTAPSGYFALGSAVQRAKLLSRLSSRYKSRIIISETIREALPDLLARKLATVKGKAGSSGETLYRLSDTAWVGTK